MDKIAARGNYIMKSRIVGGKFGFEFLKLVGAGRFDINLSTPLVLEYEAVLYREVASLYASHQVIDAVIDYHCAVARHHRNFFSGGPFYVTSRTIWPRSHMLNRPRIIRRIFKKIRENQPNLLKRPPSSHARMTLGIIVGSSEWASNTFSMAPPSPRSSSRTASC